MSACVRNIVIPRVPTFCHFQTEVPYIYPSMNTSTSTICRSSELREISTITLKLSDRLSLRLQFAPSTSIILLLRVYSELSTRAALALITFGTLLAVPVG